MNEGRLTVRVAHAVFDELDRVLPAERGPNGEPSVKDFLTIDLLPIVDSFATGFSSLAEAVPGRSDYRMLISAGVLVATVAVVGQLTSDGSVELLSIRIELEVDRETGE